MHSFRKLLAGIFICSLSLFLLPNLLAEDPAPQDYEIQPPSADVLYKSELQKELSPDDPKAKARKEIADVTKDRAQSTADHSTFDELKVAFKTGPEVTKACLKCHSNAASQVRKTIHWTWTCPHLLAENEKGGSKTEVINNFCIALSSNEPRCTSCHSGYGWKDKNFDFSNDELVDCLVCHDNTKTYVKFPAGAGHPAYETKKFSGKTFNPPDLTYIAQNVGKPTRQNCGVCHFFGGGGEGVKHGDLDYTMFKPDRDLDVHMDVDGLNFTCTQCHTTTEHHIAGRCNHTTPPDHRVLPGMHEERTSCEACHGLTPHEHNKKMNQHTDKVACESCHIPTFARKKPTKLWWDWSKAGQFDENGKPIVKKDENGFMTYHTKKGEFRWGINVVPEYYWYNGKMDKTFIATKIDNPDSVFSLNQIHGDYNDKTAKIWPFKVHRGKQVFDPENKTFLVPKLFGPKGTDAYWQTYDWNKAVTAGMNYINAPYSGKYDFIETEMYWPIAHMVAPEEKALTCTECHARNGRLSSEALAGFYMPGRDNFPMLDKLGIIIILLTAIAAIFHGILRIAFNKKG